MKPAVRWVLLCGLALAQILVACSRQPRDEAYLALSFWEFDQDLDGGWRIVAERDGNLTAAGMIETYLRKKEGLEPGAVGYLHYHAGQLYVQEGDPDRALPHFEMSYVDVDSFPERFPRTWNHLVDGTLGFLNGDMEAVVAARDAMAVTPGFTRSDSMFYRSMKHLATQEGVPYTEAIDSIPE